MAGGVNIVRTNGNLGRKDPSQDMISGLCTTGVAVSGGAALNTIYELNSVDDAEDLGINAAYDTTNVTLVYYHIKEFFRLCPNGKLFIILVAQSATLTQLCDKATTNGLAKLLRDPKCRGKIRQVAVARNPASGYSPTLANGIDSDSIAVSGGVYSGAVVKAQALAEEERDQHRPVFILVEGRSFNGTAPSAIDLRASNCNKVALTILQDKAVGDANALYAGHAAVGTVLGLIAARKVNESIGWVQECNIQSAADEAFVSPALSSNTLISSYSLTDQNTLDTKGFILAKTYEGYPGVFVQDSPTCALVSDDFSTIENNRTMDKAERKVYLRLLPKVNSPQKVDAATGKLAPGVCKYFEAEAENELQSMVTGEEVSGVDAWVDAEQDILSTETLEVKVEITPTGKAKTITAVLGFKNPFN